MPAVDAIADDLDAVLKDIEALGLRARVAELDSFGLTVVPPHQAGSPGMALRLRDAVLRLAERRSGIKPDVATGASHAHLPATAGQAGEAWLWRILQEDPVFEEALMNPVGLALMTYLLGYSAKLSSSSALLKGPVAPASPDDPPKPLGLHSDNRGLPAPFPPFAQVAAVTWALTDYTFENGALGYLPGSHKLCRQPTPDESLDAVVPVEAAAGSLIVWHGNTWHAPFPRRAPGLRISMLFYFCREYLTAQERYGTRVPAEALARNPPRFRTLMGLADPYGWDEGGPDMALLRASRSGRSQYS
ncbi:MAG: hypothetical protein F4X81_07085 [Gammaproteobacteria bacterium]|nr:hypothetical protein [Gammaproteobacteria bacterium]MYE51216.1 hypothetical protein [Gammaproteobacteria bacterium]MYF50084.1 hypothetical protein [Gammaproteobacteria bacterium]MYH15825.1 hypothetical protein [Gammaproteobacteria bacterium]MYK84442.1 hypothetical protein [Gammaproteobacteria bacterium]